jgi:hypothetical protein
MTNDAAKTNFLIISEKPVVSPDILLKDEENCKLRQSVESLKTPHLSCSTPRGTTGNNKKDYKASRPKTAEPSRSGIYRRLHSTKTCQRKHLQKNDIW